MTAHTLVARCPACGKPMDVTRLECRTCATALEGRFRTCDFCQLAPDQAEFVRIFLSCRGNIREVERELAISYPTVRNRLNAVIRALGFDVEDRQEIERLREDVLSQLESGTLGAEEALRILKQGRSS